MLSTREQIKQDVISNLREYNACHDKKTGRFCFSKGSSKNKRSGGHTRPQQFYKGDSLNHGSSKYQKLSSRQKLKVLRHGANKYDVYKNGGFKHYTPKKDMPKSKKLNAINKDIGKAEGIAGARNKKFWEAHKKFEKGQTSSIDIKDSKGSTKKLSPKQAETYYRTNVTYQRYKATLLKMELDSKMKRKKK